MIDKYSFNMSCIFDGKPSADEILQRLGQSIDLVVPLSPHWARQHWMLGGDSLEEASLYEVFDGESCTDAALAVTAQQFKGDSFTRQVTIWNGRTNGEGASIKYIGVFFTRSLLIMLQFGNTAISHPIQVFAGNLSKLIAYWKPRYSTFDTPAYYADHRVFKDRPSAGWMLYLPHPLTQSDVPEARGVFPVMDGKQQLGTILASTVDEPFSEENPEHVRVANQIEVRLVGLDVMPRIGAAAAR